MKRTYLLPVALLLSGALAGCSQGVNANTTIQDETGNGIAIEAGPIKVASATIVAGDPGSGRGSVSAVVVNRSLEPETLDAIEVDGVAATLSPSSVTIEPNRSILVATNGDVTAEVDLEVEAGEFVELQLEFSESGYAVEQALVVPPVGYYLDYAPAGTTGETESEDEAGGHSDDGHSKDDGHSEDGHSEDDGHSE